MLEHLLEWLAVLIIDIIDQIGYAGIFVLMSLESANVPIPSEITMPFSGFLASTGRLNFYGVVLAGAFGNLIGSLTAYYIGFWGGRPFAKKYGKYLFIHEYDIERAEYMFAKYGKSIAFFSRLFPIVRTFISTPAGIARMNIWQFSAYTFAGSLIWSAVLAYAGFVAGENWDFLGPYFKRFDWAIAGLGIAAIVWWILRHNKIKRKYEK
ncbi:MAG: DedA family protein [Candidatus Spechtbacteria bacterium]|nr:DedA family protein [Candidatus Spechtbacteria bacterium]